MNQELLLQIVFAVCTGAGVYAGVRADLAALKVKAEMAIHDSENAHQRLNEHINLHHVKG